MSKLKTQFGTSATADFEKNTWTFEMIGSFSVTAGDFAILPTQKYQSLINLLDKLEQFESKNFDIKVWDEIKVKKQDILSSL